MLRVARKNRSWSLILQVWCCVVKDDLVTHTHTHTHTHVRLLDERLTDRNLNNDTARPNVSFKMQL